MTRKYTIDQDFFEDIDTENKAYWLGFISADGSITNSITNRKSYDRKLEIGLSIKDINHLHLFNKDLNSTYKIKLKNENTCRLTIHSKTLVKSLENLGVTPCKTFTLSPPYLDESLIPHYIRGYFDGDGCIHYKQCYKISKKDPSKLIKAGYQRVFNLLGNYNMLNYFKSYLLISKEVKPYKSIYELRTGSKKDITSIYNYLYIDSTLCLKRKQDIFKKIIGDINE